MRLLGFERRWMTTLFEAIYPSGYGIEVTAPLDRFADAVVRVAPTRVALGLRAATWILTLLGPLLAGRFSTLTALTPDARAQVLDRLSRHRVFLVRELPMLMKTVGAMGVFGVPDAQRQLGVERVDATPPGWASP